MQFLPSHIANHRLEFDVLTQIGLPTVLQVHHGEPEEMVCKLRILDSVAFRQSFLARR